MNLRMTQAQFRKLANKAAPKRRQLSPATIARRAARMAEWGKEMATLNDSRTVFLPARLENPLNGSQGRSRGAAMGKARERKDVRQRIAYACKVNGVPIDLPVRVLMVRHGPRAMDEGCGLNASLKSVRDGVADYFGKNDKLPCYQWVYDQRTAPAKCFGVVVEFSYP